MITTGILAATAAGAVLPTGGMLVPHPAGPSRADLPAPTSISAYRIPTDEAYGLTGHTEIPIARSLREEAGYVSLRDVPDRPPTSGAKTAPVCQAFVAVCPVALRDERKPVRPKPQFSSVFEGQRYRFCSADAKASFDANPRRYAPAEGGRDVVLAASGAENCEGSLKFAGFYHDRLYLFQTQESAKTFHANPGKYAEGL